MLSALPVGNRGRKAVAAPSNPSPELVVWRYFAKRFRETYGAPCPWNGTGQPWPTVRNPHAASGLCPWDGNTLPTDEDNAAALARIVELADGNALEACSRIERLFSNRATAATGVSLQLAANWWKHAGSDAQLARHAAAVIGGRA